MQCFVFFLPGVSPVKSANNKNKNIGSYLSKSCAFQKVGYLLRQVQVSFAYSNAFLKLYVACGGCSATKKQF